MVDNYGNYFCQKLLSSCSVDQRLTILKNISPKFIEICCNRKGTHTIQAMFDLINRQDEEEFIKNGIQGNVIVLSKVSNIFIILNTGCTGNPCCVEGDGNL